MSSASVNPVNSLVAALIQERSCSQNPAQTLTTPTGSSSPKLQRHEQQWAKLEKEPIYLLKLTIKVGVQSLRLEGSHLGIRDTVLRLLVDSQRASGGYAAKISKRLRDAANKLQARQKIIYNRYTVLSEPFRFVHESALTSALQAIEEMHQEADKLRSTIVEAYDEEYAEFLEWAYQVLSSAALEPDEVELALRQYAGAYPTREELQTNSLQILVEGPIKIPSLLERSQQEAELIQQAAAQAATEVERQKLRLLQRSQETLQQTLISTLYNTQTRSRDEADAKLAQLLESFNLEGQNCTSRTGQKWETLISRLEVLVQYDPNLEPIIENARQLMHLYLTDTPNLEQVQQKLEDFRAILKERVRQQDSSIEGQAQLTKALALDAGYSELLQRLDAIASSPDPEQLRQLNGKLASMENLFKFRTKDLQKRWEMAENAVRKSLGVEEIFKPKATDSTASNASETIATSIAAPPYDPEAGF